MEKEKFLQNDNDQLAKKINTMERELAKTKKDLELEIAKRETVEQGHQLLFNISNDALFINKITLENLPGRFVEANEAACRLLGYSKAELLKLTPYDINKSPDKMLEEMLTKLLVKGNGFFELSYLKKTGEELTVEVSANLIKSLEGERLIFSSVRDLTERNKLKDALYGQLQLEKLISEISTSFINCKIDDLDATINAALGKILKFVDVTCSFVVKIEDTKASVTHNICDNCQCLIHDMLQNRDLNHFKGWYEVFIKNEPIFISNINNLSPRIREKLDFIDDLGYTSLLIIPMVSYGEIKGAFCLATVKKEKVWDQEQLYLLKVVGEIFTNALQFKRALDVINASEKRNRALINAIPDRLFLTTKDGTVLDLKVSEEYPLAYPSLDYLGKKAYHALAEEHRILVQEGIEKAVQSGQMVTLEFSYKKNDKTVFEEVRIIVSGHDEVVITVRDITDRILLEERKNKTKENIEKAQRLAALGVMATSIAHELNQPLNAITMAAGGALYLDSKGIKRDNSKLIEDFKVVLSEAQRMNSILRNIRYYLKNTEVKKEWLSINATVNAVVELLQKETNFRDIKISKNLQPDLPLIWANHLQFKQLLLNLFVNSQQSLSKVNNLNKRVEINTKYTDELVVEICDNGIGINEDILANIFEPFFTTNQEGEHMGLGLAIAQIIVNDLAGNITVKNNELGGATFVIRLPANHRGDENES